MTLIEFVTIKPNVAYTNIGYEPTKYAFYPSGIFGLGNKNPQQIVADFFNV